MKNFRGRIFKVGSDGYEYEDTDSEDEFAEIDPVYGNDNELRDAILQTVPLLLDEILEEEGEDSSDTEGSRTLSESDSDSDTSEEGEGGQERGEGQGQGPVVSSSGEGEQGEGQQQQVDSVLYHLIPIRQAEPGEQPVPREDSVIIREFGNGLFARLRPTTFGSLQIISVEQRMDGTTPPGPQEHSPRGLDVDPANSLSCVSSEDANRNPPSASAPSASESGESTITTPTQGQGQDEHETTCNPMVSDDSDLDETEQNEHLRGDRIGSTTYAERHVLKLLMNWIQQLPKYSSQQEQEEQEKDKEDNTDKSRFLERDFEEEMSLLWDMSYEPDVMNFLIQQNMFNIIQETLQNSTCDRLTEIALGILANILSQQSIVEDFAIHDASLKLVESVILLGQRMPPVSVLIQVFAVLRRITWSLRNVDVVKTWMELLLSQEFLTCANFILSSSTNVLLLGNVIVTLYSILESLLTNLTEAEESKEGDGEEEGSSSFFGKALTEKKDFEPYKPFCETNFVLSLCEGLTELMKNPKPKIVRKMTSTHEHERKGENDDHDQDLEEFEIPVPEGHVTIACLNGLSSFFILYKTPNGKESIRANYIKLMNILVTILSKFCVLTDSLSQSTKLDYFSLGLTLLSFCHRQLPSLSNEVLQVPVLTSIQLVKEEEGDEDLDKDKTLIPLLLHEHLASLGDRFGYEEISKYKEQEQNKEFFLYVDKVVKEVAAKEQEEVG